MAAFLDSSKFSKILYQCATTGITRVYEVANQTPPPSTKQGLFERSVSVRTAAAILIAVVIFAVVIVVAIPRLQGSQGSLPEFMITSQSAWWTNEEVTPGVGIVPIYHVKVEVKNYGDTAGVCVLHVKVEEPGGRFWSRFRFVSISPGDTAEEQFIFTEIVDENVVYSAWLTNP